MKEKSKNKTYYFVDESGDPVFYDKRGNNIVGQGASKTLILGYIETRNPKSIRRKLKTLREKIKVDEYLRSIPSWEKSINYFHAKDDCPEIREKVFKLIKGLEFKAQFIVARKIESIFKGPKIQSSESKFYSYLISKLFENRLHLNSEISIYFEKRGSKDKQAYLENAIAEAKYQFERKWNFKNDSIIKVYPQVPTDEPCLQVSDYMNWAVQRLFNRKDERYYKFVEEKVSLVVDLYDFAAYKSDEKSNYYSRNNKLRLKKISPL